MTTQWEILGFASFAELEFVEIFELGEKRMRLYLSSAMQLTLVSLVLGFLFVSCDAFASKEGILISPFSSM